MTDPDNDEPIQASLFSLIDNPQPTENIDKTIDTNDENNKTSAQINRYEEWAEKEADILDRSNDQEAELSDVDIAEWKKVQQKLRVSVAVDVKLFTSLTYDVPTQFADKIAPGQLIQVPFGNKAVYAIVLDVCDANELIYDGKIREIHEILEVKPLLNKTQIKFLSFISKYYFAPIGQVFQLALPSLMKKDIIKCYRKSPPKSKEIQSLSGVAKKAWESQLLNESKPVPVAVLKNSLKTTYAELAELETLGLVEVEYKDQNATVKTESFYTLNRQPAENELRGKKQLAVINLFMDGAKELSQSEIRKRISVTTATINSLVEKGILAVEEREVLKSLSRHRPIKPRNFPLTRDQKSALESIVQAIHEKTYQGFLLHGVTGSGKTEVYLHAIKYTIEQGRKALVLLPEISLTPQVVAIFSGFFSQQKIATFHSGLTDREKFDEWQRIARGETNIVIGTRSALFAPLDNIGIIIVDEEHDSSFKQDNGVCYNARDMALVLGKYSGCPVVLGSATPMMETYYNAEQGRLKYLELPERVNKRPLPAIEFIDLRQTSGFPISIPLREAIIETKEAGAQSILFLNRRGFSTCVVCESCGYTWECEHCSVAMTYHHRSESLRCHHCDFSVRIPEICPKCGTGSVSLKGVGTEQLEAELQQRFASVGLNEERLEIARLDGDTASTSNLLKTLDNFRSGKIDLLLGTQMITKGHDFPKVTLVGIVLAETSLNFPDFRAGERTFQLLLQVAGRAGRAEMPGKVLIQTFNPEHYVLKAVEKHDFKGFYNIELAYRQALFYPPFGHLVLITLDSRDESAVNQEARRWQFLGHKMLQSDSDFDGVALIGPALAPIERLRGRTRWHLVLLAKERRNLHAFLGRFLTLVEYEKGHPKVRVNVDVDPYAFM